MAGNILLVEDNQLARQNIAGVLSRHGYQVTEAQSGEDALKLIRDVDRFDVVITDLRMTGMVNGLDVLAYQTQVCPGRGAILITAFGSDDVKEKARLLGAVYMDKPIRFANLLGEIKSFTAP